MMCTANRECDEGLPLLLFAVRETNQKGSVPLTVFGHTIRGPLRLLKEKFLLDKLNSKENILDYISLRQRWSDCIIPAVLIVMFFIDLHVIRTLLPSTR